MKIPSPILHGVQITQEWLKELKDKGDLADEAAAFHVLRAVLHQLRDRLTVEEAVDLAAQMPLIVRGLFYEGWQPRKVPSKIRSKEQFLDELSKDILPYTYPVEWAVRSVFALLWQHCGTGEIADVVGLLPDDLKELWPDSARIYRRAAT